MRSTIVNVREVEKGTYRVEYYNAVGDPESFRISAKDELDAFTQAKAKVENGVRDMRTFILCATTAFVALVSSITYSCSDSRAQSSVDMRECAKAGKSYVSEDGGYSCRDPFVKSIK